MDATSTNNTRVFTRFFPSHSLFFDHFLIHRQERNQRTLNHKNRKQRCNLDWQQQQLQDRIWLFMQPEISLFRRTAFGAAMKGRTADPTLQSTLENSKPDPMFTRVNLSPQGIENHADGDPEFNDFRVSSRESAQTRYRNITTRKIQAAT
ncbi:hypothetical protein V6N13_128342 [Hibiscus sabdariffa]